MVRLSQADNIAEIDDLGCGEWTTLYEFHDNGQGSRCSYSALLTPLGLARSLNSTSWDIMIGQGMPGGSVAEAVEIGCGGVSGRANMTVSGNEIKMH